MKNGKIWKLLETFELDSYGDIGFYCSRTVGKTVKLVMSYFDITKHKHFV